jgi:hypothetical protein
VVIVEDADFVADAGGLDIRVVKGIGTTHKTVLAKLETLITQGT